VTRPRRATVCGTCALNLVYLIAVQGPYDAGPESTTLF
jgi:hypothetical protein